MLVLRRKAGQSIKINDNIYIRILDIQNEHIVRIGIEAPPDISVHRLEIYNLIQKENQSAASADTLNWLQGASHDNDTDDKDRKHNDTDTA